ncbi:MAG: hypothetical protein E7286_02540 [Lachnospiraceae bacterium]|nr:hypothetical protein [Lachnospiraceae bacterium]
MDYLIDKIYDKIICTEDEYVVGNKWFDEKVEEIISPLSSKMKAEEVEEIRALIYKATYYAQKEGFKLGVNATVKLMNEVINTTKQK